MPTLVQRNAQETVEATVESTSKAPVEIAQSTMTTPLATATTPLTTVQHTATAVSMIDSDKKLPPVNPIIDYLIKLHTSAREPIEVSALALCSATGVMYNNFEVLTNRQFTVQQEKRVTNENDPSRQKITVSVNLAFNSGYQKEQCNSTGCSASILNLILRSVSNHFL
jgi:hypothetical protein